MYVAGKRCDVRINVWYMSHMAGKIDVLCLYVHVYVCSLVRMSTYVCIISLFKSIGKISFTCNFIVSLAHAYVLRMLEYKHVQ